MADMNTPILQPVIALVLWTFVMWGWLYATRIPAIRKSGQSLRPDATREEFNAMIPPSVRWKADNYNHLMEQPTLFYAVALTLAVADAGTGLNAGLAWLYVGTRVVHSVVQATVNIILLRFAIFAVSSVVLFALAVRAALVVFT